MMNSAVDSAKADKVDSKAAGVKKAVDSDN
jgi:hypothetical protein